ncbi:MAG: phosphomannomutase/phosphoglucomutase [Desulfohalobiaceae bacterium]
MPRINSSVFRAYDIRGIVDQDFDPHWVHSLGQACGTYFLRQGIGSAVVGRDCRHSSPEYQQRLVQGLASCGLEVIFLPMAPTPVFYYAIKKLGKRAGVMITASHNPPEFNGFKIWCGENTIHSDSIQDLRRIMEQGEFAQGLGTACEWDPRADYLQELSQGIRLQNPFRVVVDGGNGSAGLLCAQLLRRIGAEVIELFCEPNPDFPNHHPDPTLEENLQDMRTEVHRHGARLGLGLDGDGDRLGVLDEQGQVIYGDRLLAIYARDLLSRRPGALVLGEVKCSHLLYQDIQAHRGSSEMYKTGHSLIKARMQETGALLAGEMSGHMFFAEGYYGYDDAIYAALRLLLIMDSSPEKPLSSYLQDWPQVVSTPEIRMDCPEELKFLAVEKLREHFQNQEDGFQLIDVDGVRLTFPDGWGLVRASNTQPVLVLRFEAETGQRLQEIRDFMQQPLQEIISSLEKHG